jgi:hypothetical protein
MSLFKASLLKGMVAAVLGVAAFAASSSAEAATLNFVLSGDYSASWSLDSDPTPTGSSAIDGYTYFNGVAGADPLSLVFYSVTDGTAGGGIRISTTPDVNTEIGSIFDLAGDQIYSIGSTEAAPHFSVGVFDVSYDFITNAATHVPTTLTVTAATTAVTPVPAALPLFVTALAGMGFVGWRRRNAAGQI